MSKPHRHIGVFICHGIFGSPREFEGLEFLLGEAGYQTHALSQYGHGENRHHTAMTEVSAQKLINHCAQEYWSFAHELDETYIIGHSMGGITALITAAQTCQQPEHNLAGVIALATPCEHAYWINYPRGYLHFPISQLPKALRLAPEVITGLDKPEFKPWWIPSLFKETSQLLEQLHLALPHINIPTTLAHSVLDLSIPYQEMNKIAERIGKPELIETHTLEHCGHQIFPSSQERERVAHIILQFLEQTHSHRPTALPH